MKKLLLSSMALVVLAACSSASSPMTQLVTKIPQVQEIEHHNYELVSINGKEYKAEKGGNIPSIAFSENMQITGTMCNNFFGKGSISKRGVITAKGMGMTRMLCEDATLNNLDGDISDLLTNGAEITISEDGQYLKLMNPTTSLEFKLSDKK